jgi:proline iminopeptidase
MKTKLKKLGKILGVLLLLVIAINVVFMAVMVRYMPKIAASRPADYEDVSQTIAVNDFNLWYRTAGVDTGKSPVIVIHGGPGFSSDYFKDYLSFLEDDRECIYYDQRGSGNSEIKSNLELYSLDYMVDDLEMVINQLAGDRKVVLLAHSYGGLVALEYLKDHQENVDKVVLVSSLLGQKNGFDSATDLCKIIFKHGFPSKDPTKANEWFKKVLPTFFEGCFYDEENASYLENFGYDSFATLAQTGSSIGKIKINSYKDIESKVLIIYGEKEYSESQEKYQLQLNSVLKNSNIVKMENSGHFSFMEENSKFANAVNDFLEE